MLILVMSQWIQFVLVKCYDGKQMLVEDEVVGNF